MCGIVKRKYRTNFYEVKKNDRQFICKSEHCLHRNKLQESQQQKEFLLTLEDGIHTLVVESSDAINCFSFTVKAETTPSEPGNSTSDEPTNSTKADMGIPQTGETNSWKIWVYLFAFSGLILIIALKKHKKISR